MYFCSTRPLVLTGGERFSCVFRSDGVPAYYPTALALKKRAKAVSSNTLRALALDLIHIGLWGDREGIDINSRLENGRYFEPHEIETLAEACSYSTSSMRRIVKSKIKEIKRGISFTKRDLVGNSLKSRRLATAVEYFNFVGTLNESDLPRRSHELRDRSEFRSEMVDQISANKPRMLGSRTKNISYVSLARVTTFILEGSPSLLWENEASKERNWAILRLLLETGIRQGELRQIKVEDLDLNQGTLTIVRRPDDPEDPRAIEPNAKTFDRIIPLSDALMELLEAYILGSGSDVAEVSGTPFLFLSHSNNSRGQPLSDKTVQNIVSDVGDLLAIPGLSPHDLRHTWIQNLANWSIENGIEPAEFERFANNLGGWSYLSKMASEYRGDQLTEQAYAAGLRVENER